MNTAFRLPVHAIVLLATLLCGAWTAAHAADRSTCALSEDLKREISNRYPQMHVVSMTDLLNEDKLFFAKEHGADCPGESTLDFYGDGQPVVVINLITDDHKNGVLIAANKARGTWNVRKIDDGTAGSTPVVWTDRPGTYLDIESGKEMHARWPVVVWCGYDSWAIVYSWSGSAVEKVWVKD